MSKYPGEYEKGRGAQCNPTNRFQKQAFVQEHVEAIDDWETNTYATQEIQVYPKSIVNKVSSPDVPFNHSLNPYQGCEHGCIYCYARVSHQYWGYSAGSEFEQKILIKKNAPELLVQWFSRKGYVPKTLMLSGNTDCYQPLERKHKLTRSILALCLAHKHPVGIITKNSLIQRDLDLLEDLARNNLVSVAISLTTLNEDLRRKMEPRTASAKKKLDTIKKLVNVKVPVSVMMAPIIPGLNSTEIFDVAKQTAAAGAQGFGYTTVRLNGEIADIFKDWIEATYPLRAQKVLHQIAALHGGKLSASSFKERMRGSGNEADQIRQMVHLARKKFFTQAHIPALTTSLFRPPNASGQLGLFD